MTDHSSSGIQAPAPWNRTIARSRLFDALSLLLPAGETFVIETLEQWRATAGSLLTAPMQAEVDRLISEERAHQRAHERYNQALIAATPTAADAALRVSRSADSLADLSLTMKLALAVAFEHLTTVLSREVLERPYLMPDDGSTHSRMWRWHAREELAHSHVAMEAAALHGVGRARQAVALCLATGYLAYDVICCWVALCRCDIAAGANRWSLVADTFSFVLRGLPSLGRMSLDWFRWSAGRRLGTGRPHVRP